MYVAQTNDEVIYMVSLITFPEKKDASADEQVMRSLINGMVSANPENKLASVKPATFLDKSALNFEIANSQTIIRGRCFVDDHTVYVLSQISKTSLDTKEAFDQFVDSFTLEKSKVPS